MTQASNEAWMANIRRTSSDRDASGNGFIEVSALIHQSIIREKTIRAAADGAAFAGLAHGYRKQHLSAALMLGGKGEEGGGVTGARAGRGAGLGTRRPQWRM